MALVAAFFLAVFALALPLSLPEARQSTALRSSVLVVGLAHQVASICHVAMNGLPTMRMDPFAFHRQAQVETGRLTDNLYTKILHVAYELFGADLLLGCEISNFFFGVSLAVFIRLLFRVGCKSNAPSLVLIFGLPLSCVFNTSVTLRESLQSALFLALALILLQVSQDGLRPNVLLLVPIFWCMHHLHHGFTAVLTFSLPVAMAWALRARPIIVVGLLAIVFSGSFFYLGAIVERLKEESVAFNAVASGNLGYVEEYAKKVEDGRTSFGVELDLSSIGAALRTGPQVLVYYLYSPLPWQIRGTLDMYGILESGLRLLLTFYAAKGMVKSRGRLRNELILLSGLFIFLEMAWAAGTANWGTAFRHRVVGQGLLVALAGCGWLLSRQGEGDVQVSSTDSGTSVLSIRARRRALTAKSRNR